MGEYAQQRMTLAMTSVSFRGDGVFIDSIHAKGMLPVLAQARHRTIKRF
ncbi:hypothetical protein CFT9_25529 [Pseudomonas sp. CFT9]|nr:hypothetical protein CFT9_25529 [Pseudomonas sp. CFT9]EPL08186.1 hypothetical protein CF150_21336 [Pseudomonas sp. CF150]